MGQKADGKQAVTPLACGESDARGPSTAGSSSGGPPPRDELGEELTLGASKNGVQKRTGRPSDWTEEMAARFVEVLADSCNVSLAARAIGRSIRNVYEHRTRQASFRAAWDQALSTGYAKLEMMMLERALHGTEKVVTLKSGESRIMREYNDRVALALLRHHRDSVAAIDAAVDEQDYQEACERIIEKLSRLRERDAGAPPLETKSAGDRIALIALALRLRSGQALKAGRGGACRSR